MTCDYDPWDDDDDTSLDQFSDGLAEDLDDDDDGFDQEDD